MISIYSNLKDALKDLNKRCKYPTNVVFDIDGTLLIGKNPVHILCKYYQNLCNNSDCLVTVLTARPENMRSNTIIQLKKNNLQLFDNIIMKDESIPETENSFKIRLVKQINPQISIGNRWHDLNLDDDVDKDNIPDDKYVVGNFWLKVPK
jgi:hypothetical protein